MVKPTGTSSIVGGVKKKVLTDKSFEFFPFSNVSDKDWLKQGAAQTDLHPNINRRNGFSMNRRWMPLIDTLEATSLDEFSSSVIDPTSEGKNN
jgi:hypothetical protein